MAEDDFKFKPAIESGQRMAQSNQSAPATECSTCGGDRFVLVASRPPAHSVWMRQRGLAPAEHGIEEYAPCPSCNGSLDASFRRGSDGSLVTPPDTARVLERMARPPLRGAGRIGEIPEWVFVWNYARRIRSPRNLVPLPQQQGEFPASGLMSQTEYQTLREEWLAAGSPRATHEQLLAV